MGKQTIEMRLKEKNGKTSTIIKIGKNVNSPIRTIVNLYCSSNPTKNRVIKSSSLYDYYEFEGDHINKFAAIS